jgi:hypothetical protein
MRRLPLWVLFILGLCLWLGLADIKQALPLRAQQTLTPPVARIHPSELVLSKAKIKANSKSEELKPFAQVIKGAEKMEGLFTLYRHKQTGKIYLEVQPQQLNKNYLASVTMESGIGERGLYSGVPLQTLLFYFRRMNNNLHFVVRNVNFRTEPGDPQARSVERSFSDSVLDALPIKSIHPTQGSILVDLGDLLLGDLPGLTPTLKESLKGNYQLDANKSYFGTAKTFPANVEIESVYGFSLTNGTGDYLQTLPDNRALTLRVRYSLSQLEDNKGYRPRLADDRVGYFVTTYKDFSNPNRRDPFVRYINRWHLEKQDPSAPLSPPKKPIVFWIENAIPLEYREAIREGVLMWNKAFEKAGFKDAIQVQQMPDRADWDPADVNYNTIRWFNSVDGLFARGPARVNPLTGEILDADIIVDAGLVRDIKQDFRRLVEQNQTQENSLLSSLIDSGNLCPSTVKRESSSQRMSFLSQVAKDHDLCYGVESVEQSGIDRMGLTLLSDGLFESDRMKEYVNQRLRWLIAHEVGHTLGLRHNFRGSTLLSPKELNDIKTTQTKGLVNSVMDYLPINLAPQGKPQGEYFPSAVGVYDQWAIEYGYKESDNTVASLQVSAIGTFAERQFLDEIAKRSTSPELAYATDEDVIDLNPDANRWDMSNDVLSYAQTQLDNARAMWARLEKRYPVNGGSYTELSELFNSVFWHYVRNTYFISKYIAGQSFYRDHAGDPNGRLPFEPVPVAKQREALQALGKYVFAENAFNFSPQLLNKLAPSRWRDWGNDVKVERLDYPIHQSISSLQNRVLGDLLSSDRLTRLQDLELKSAQGQALTLPELFKTLQESVWTEVLKPDDKSMNISSIRRALQRNYLNRLTNMVLRTANVPEDARTLAWYQLRQLQGSLNQSLRRHGREMDAYTKAHLEETRSRISKALDAQILSQ